MKLRIVSDLHIEHDPQELPIMDDEDKQVLILGGDITPNVGKYREFLRDLSYRFKDIIIIYGNHEYYGHKFGELKDDMNDMCTEFKNVHLLDNMAINLDGVAIYGGTLWTSAYKDIWYGLNDFNVVTYIEDGINMYSEEYDNSLAHLDEMIPEFDVVITHHAPSYKSVAPMFENSPYNKYFVNNLDGLVQKGGEKLKLWVHGHCHNSSNYQIDNCTVICNPKGYFKENKDYNNELIYEI